MARTGGKMLFRLGLALAFGSICLASYAIFRGQSGPSWEVPVAVVELLRIVPVMSTLLVIGALSFYGWSHRQGGVARAAQRGFLVVLLIAVALPFVIWYFEPEQWPVRDESLSFLAWVQFAPVVLVSLISFWLIGFHWLRNS